MPDTTSCRASVGVFALRDAARMASCGRCDAGGSVAVWAMFSDIKDEKERNVGIRYLKIRAFDSIYTCVPKTERETV